MVRRVVRDLLGRLVVHDDRADDVGARVEQAAQLMPFENGVVLRVQPDTRLTDLAVTIADQLERESVHRKAGGPSKRPHRRGSVGR